MVRKSVYGAGLKQGADAQKWHKIGIAQRICLVFIDHLLTLNQRVLGSSPSGGTG